MTVRSRIAPGRLLPLGCLVMAASAAACKGDTPAQPDDGAFQGGYQLHTIGGQQLPVAFHCFADRCEYVTDGRIEVMSRGRVRYIMETQGPPYQPFRDTVISTYTANPPELILHRTYAGGSTGTYDDTGSFDVQGRVLLVPHRIGNYLNSATFFYVPD